MNRRLNQIFCYFISFAAAYFVNFMYTFKTGFGEAMAAVATKCGTTTIYNNYSANCAPGNYVYPSGSKCGTHVSQFCASWGRAGWTCGYTYLGVDTGRCDCSSISMVSTLYETQELIPCGTRIYCGSAFARVRCNPGPVDAGYALTASTGVVQTECTCCPRITEYTAANSSAGVFVEIQGLSASKATCYLQGKFYDRKGLIEFTDSNRCYYVS